VVPKLPSAYANLPNARLGVEAEARERA
jgi:hypothetical protein